MDLNKTIIGRHSIREYKEKDVPYETIGKIINFARLGPSAGNIQNWRFIVVKDKQKKRNNIPILLRAILDE